MGVLTLGLCGCANLWDELSSHDFKFNSLFSSPDPLTVLSESSDGNERAKALAALREPLQNGGTQKDQDKLIEILTTAATRDHTALCRMSAVRSLGRFKDPRAAQAIEAAYLDKKLPFDSETDCLIRQQCLESLAETGGPIALRLLVLVAKEPATVSDTQDAQEALDRRLTALRGLAKFKESEAAAALAAVMRSDRDVAVRDRAHESLVACTGKNFGPDAPEWQVYLPNPSGILQTGGSKVTR
jgi:HEAT repeat protein